MVSKIKFSDIGKLSNLLLTTNLKKYIKAGEIKNGEILSFFLKKKLFNLGQIKREDYQQKGKIPIIDQSATFIAGYSDDENLKYTGSLPVIVFGDHTRNFKYVNFEFIQGADGIKVLIPDTKKVNPKFFYFLLNYISVPSRGYNRHFSLLKKQKYQNIDINTQNNVISQIEPIETEISKLQSKIQEPLAIINEVFADYYGYSKTLWKEFGKGMTAGTQKSNAKISKYYKVGFSQIQNSKIMRMSSRFHNPNTQDLTEFLFSKQTTKISKIITRPVKRGKQPIADEDGTVYAIKTGQLKNDFVDISASVLVTENFYYQNERAQTIFGDILIASTGKVSLGKVDFNQIKEKSVVDGHISILKIDNEKYNSRFLTYFLRNILGAYQIERDFTGATNQIELASSEIENFDIPNISIKEQEKIVGKISKQLNKQKEIENNIADKQNKINELIENIINKN